MKSILFLTNLPAPYTVDFFEGLGKKYCLTVLFERNHARNREKEWLSYHNDFFEAIYLSGCSVGDDLAFCPEVLKYLKRDKYDLIIVGDYSSPTGVLAICSLKMHGIPYFIHADGGLIHCDSHIKATLKKYLLSGAAGYMSSGEKTDDYLVYYGANREKCYHYPFTSIHETDIIKRIKTKEEKKQIKDSLFKEAEEKFIVLSVGSIIYRKGFDVLIRAAKYLLPCVEVYIIGGDATENLKQLIDDLSVSNVHFIKFIPHETIKKCMECSDVFVLPTREDIWGLVVNEAMAAGLPVITTDQCVAGIEMIKQGMNGYIIPVENSEIMAEKINNLVEDPDLLLKMGISSRETGLNYTLERMIEAYGKCIDDFFYHL